MNIKKMYFHLNEINLPSLLVLITIFTSVSLENNHLINILELKDNLFYVINENVHSVINRLFAVLKLKSDFLKSSKMHLLLTMHSDLNNIAVKNFNVFKEIINISKDSNSSNTNSNILELEKVIDQALKEYKHENEIQNYTKETILDNITSISRSIESLDFLEDFLRKINTLSADNFTMTHLNITLNNEEKDIFAQVKNKYPDLKIWSPPTYMEKQQLFSNLTNRRIYKGKRARIKKYAFMASIHVMKEFMCSGSIITKNMVITAASCLQIVYNNKKLRENPETIYIRVGSDYTKRFGETIQIRELHFHPQYEPFSLKNNLLLLRMAKKIKFLKKKKRLRRIQYDKTPQRLRDVDEVTILGWGATDNVFGVKTYQPLAGADIDVYDFDRCQEIYSKNYVTDRNFCVGFVDKGGGACKGDVGGPGVVDGILVGIISFGPPVCGALDMPTVLTKLGFYASWIDSVIKQQSIATSSANFRTSAQVESVSFPTTSTTRTHEAYPKNPNYVRTRMTQDYPEEIAILNRILNEVILSNKTLVDDILYGALEDDFEDIFKSSSKLHVLHHPLINKSLVLLPGIHYFSTEHQPNITISLTTTSTVKTTTHPGLNKEYLDDYDARIRYMDAVNQYTTPVRPLESRSPPITETTKYFTDRFGRARKITMLDLGDESEYSKVVSSEDSEKISDNYESNKDEESNGLSIEITKPETEHYDISKEYTPHIKRPTGKGTIISSELEIEYKPKKLKPKTTRSLKIPYTSRASRKITHFNYKSNLRGKNKYHGKSTPKRYKNRYSKLPYHSNYNY